MRREAPEPYPDRETDEAKDQDAIRHPATESDEGCRHGGQTIALEACCAKTSHNFIQIQANRSGKSGLRSVEKVLGIKSAPRKRGRPGMGRGWLDLLPIIRAVRAAPQ